MQRMAAVALTGLPGVGLALVGVTHPMVLDAGTAHHWWLMHLLLIPAWPLLGLALWWPVRRRGWVSALAASLAAVYSLAYGALDVLAGVGTGYATMRDPGPRTPSVQALFDIGNLLGSIGAYAFLGLALVVATTVVVTALPAERVTAVVAAVVVVAASVSFLDSHIYRWRGVVTVLAIGLATATLTWASRESTPRLRRVTATSAAA